MRTRAVSECSSETTGLSARVLHRRKSRGQEARNLSKVSPGGNARTGAPQGDGWHAGHLLPIPSPEGRGPGTRPLGVFASRDGRPQLQGRGRSRSTRCLPNRKSQLHTRHSPTAPSPPTSWVGSCRGACRDVQTAWRRRNGSAGNVRGGARKPSLKNLSLSLVSAFR